MDVGAGKLTQQWPERLRQILENLEKGCLCMSDMDAGEGRECRAGEAAVFSSSRLPSLLRDFHAQLSLRCHRNRNKRGAGIHLPLKTMLLAAFD
jgi:DNA-binding transcriptional LysR family regulator